MHVSIDIYDHELEKKIDVFICKRNENYKENKLVKIWSYIYSYVELLIWSAASPWLLS